MKNIYENGVLIRQYRYFLCKDSGVFLYFGENGDTLTKTFFAGNKNIGTSRQWHSVGHPKHFVTYNDSSGRRNGWEVYWYKNGNVKDSTLYTCDSFVECTHFYHNGNVAIKKRYDRSGKGGYSAVTYDIRGRKTGEIIRGNGTVVECDSIGNNCQETTLKDGKLYYPPPPEEPLEEIAFKETFWERLKQNDVAFVRKLDKKRLNVVFDRHDGVTPLHVACDTGSMEMVKMMVGRGAEVNCRNGFGHTPLAVAIFKKRMDIVLFLLDKGADPNWTEGRYHLQTAIYTAIDTKDTAFVGLLLSYGANLNTANYDGTTPLHHAACRGDSLILKMILRRDKEILRLDDDDINALDYAYMCENEQTIRVLSRIMAPNLEKNRKNRR